MQSFLIAVLQLSCSPHKPCLCLPHQSHLNCISIGLACVSSQSSSGKQNWYYLSICLSIYVSSIYFSIFLSIFIMRNWFMQLWRLRHLVTCWMGVGDSGKPMVWFSPQAEEPMEPIHGLTPCLQAGEDEMSKGRWQILPSSIFCSTQAFHGLDDANTNWEA